MESFHYIDDRAYVEQYLAGSGAKKGKKAVLYALAQKGVVGTGGIRPGRAGGCPR
ncbi:MAG: hypothetical protein ACLTGB_12915 [Blautia caecimuris]